LLPLESAALSRRTPVPDIDDGPQLALAGSQGADLDISQIESVCLGGVSIGPLQIPFAVEPACGIYSNSGDISQPRMQSIFP
jgi:hypothetical protein